MTLSAFKTQLALALLLSTRWVGAAEPPVAELSAAQTAISQAQRHTPQGVAEQSLQLAQSQLAQAQALSDKRKYRDAIKLANEARATADLAKAQADLANARRQVDEKAARNEELRRQLLINTER